jgi:predicted acyl esterase
MHTPYNRRYFTSANTPRGLTGETYPGAAARLIAYGYVVAIVDFRGLYSSHGQNIAYNRGEWVPAARMDAYDITEWLAMQPWSTGKIGMWGCSATGGSQLQAATTMPPHLKAIFPMSCEFDAYGFAVAGGMAPPKGQPTSVPPTGDIPAATRDSRAEPVDGDSDRMQLMAAISEHAHNRENAGYVPLRDSPSENVPGKWWLDSSPSSYLDEISASNVAVYLAANWDEGTTKHGAFFSYNNLKNPRKLLIGPGPHCGWVSVRRETGFDLLIEELRFFDYWLKGIQNGVMDEPAVHYYTYNAPPGKEWRSSPQWPLLHERRTNFYLGQAKTLSTVAPTAAATQDEIAVDYEVTPENLAQKGLVYETSELALDLQVTGHPQIVLFVSTTATDGDFVATLQDVAPDGSAKSYNITGRLRASHRKLDDPPYNYLGLPWHRSQEADVSPLVAGEPAELRFELLPLSVVFRKGHRIRLVLTFAAGRATEAQSPAPIVTIHRDALRRSALTLPVIVEAADRPVG